MNFPPTGIYIAAALTTVAAVALLGYVLARMAAREDRPVLVLAVLVALPLHPLAYDLVRLPLHGWLAAQLGAGPVLTAISMFYAPLTEEPAKCLVLLVPAIRRRLRPDNAVALALAVGLGFGIGEIWVLAHGIARVPAFAALPFWSFGGFFFERIVVCFLHGAMVTFAFHRLATSRSFVVGGLIGMALHFALNFPILLARIDLFGIGNAAWQHVLTLWLLAFTVVLGLALTRLSGGRFREALQGFSTCPECQAVYLRPLLVLNFGLVRYERCQHCRRFHWMRLGR